MAVTQGKVSFTCFLLGGDGAVVCDAVFMARVASLFVLSVADYRLSWTHFRRSTEIIFAADCLVTEFEDNHFLKSYSSTTARR